MTDDINDAIVKKGIEDSWEAKLAELDKGQFIAFLDEMYNNTNIPSLKATLKVARAYISGNTKDLLTDIALG